MNQLEWFKRWMRRRKFRRLLARARFGQSLVRFQEDNTDPWPSLPLREQDAHNTGVASQKRRMTAAE